MTKKLAALSSGLVAVKGMAAAPADATGRQPELLPSESTAASSPLNFKVDQAFRRRFRERAASADLKLNQLLKEALTAWEEKHGLR